MLLAAKGCNRLPALTGGGLRDGQEVVGLMVEVVQGLGLLT
jgi:hypothetical protein